MPCLLSPQMPDLHSLECVTHMFQVYLNWKRQSVVGFSLDYAVINVVGFCCYSVFNCSFYYDKDVQQRYR